MAHLGSYWTDCHEIWYLCIFQKIVEKIQFWLKSDKNNGHFRWRPLDIFIVSRSDLLRMRNVSDKFVEEIKTHILCWTTFFFGSRAVYEIMWKNIVAWGRPQMTIWHMRVTWRIPMATNTQSGYAIPFSFSLQQWWYERALILHYTYIACLVFNPYPANEENRLSS